MLQHVPSIVDHRWIHVYVWKKPGNLQAISFIGVKDGLSTIYFNHLHLTCNFSSDVHILQSSLFDFELKVWGG